MKLGPPPAPRRAHGEAESDRREIAERASRAILARLPVEAAAASPAEAARLERRAQEALRRLRPPEGDDGVARGA